MVPSLKKKKKETRKKRLSIARTMIDSIDITFSLLEIQKMVCFVFQLSFFNCYIVVTSHDKGIGKTETSMSKDKPLLSSCPLERAQPSRNYARVPGYKKK